jgi:hypothetical protein
VARRHGLTPPQPFTWRREAQKRLETEAPSTFVPDAIVKDYVRSHRRRGREMFVPLHHPPGALDQAAPLAAWDLPPGFQTLRRLMEARMIEAGAASMCRFCGCWRPSTSTAFPSDQRAAPQMGEIGTGAAGGRGPQAQSGFHRGARLNAFSYWVYPFAT